MKKLICVALVLAMLLSFTGCSLFAKSNIVKLNDDFTHEDPEGLTYDKRMVLKKDGFDADIETSVNMLAYPDTMMYDETGNIIGIYDYDATTGLAKGWMSMEDGAYIAFPEGEEVDLGMPDASRMIDIPGTVNLSIVVYGSEEKAVSSHMYFFLSDASAKDMVRENLEAMFGFALTEVNDTVLKTTEDAAAISAKFAEAEAYGQIFEKKDAETYCDVLMQVYGVRLDGGANPYKPYADHTDPEGLDFDKKVVLTASGSEAFYPEHSKFVSSMTNFVYAKDNVVIADYIYFETSSKENADELMKVIGDYYTNSERVSDTAVMTYIAGADMESLVTSYIGYSVMKDNSLDEYIRMLEGTYFSMVCQ